MGEKLIAGERGSRLEEATATFKERVTRRNRRSSLFNEKSPNFSISKVNEDFTKTGILSPWPNTTLPYKPQLGEHLPRERFSAILVPLFIQH